MEKKEEIRELKQFLEEHIKELENLNFYCVEMEDTNHFYGQNGIEYEIIKNTILIKNNGAISAFNKGFEKKYLIWKRKQKLKNLNNF